MQRITPKQCMTSMYDQVAQIMAGVASRYFHSKLFLCPLNAPVLKVPIAMVLLPQSRFVQAFDVAKVNSMCNVRPEFGV